MNRPYSNPLYIDTDDSVVYAINAARLDVQRVLIHNGNASVQTVELRDRDAISGTGGTVTGASTFEYTLPSGTLSGIDVTNCRITSNSGEATIVAQSGDTVYTKEDIGTGGENFNGSWEIEGKLYGVWTVPASITTEFEVSARWNGLYVEVLPANVTITVYVDRTRSTYDVNAVLGDARTPVFGQTGQIN